MPGAVHRRRAGAIALAVLLTSCPRAFGLNPALEVSQYSHTAWKNRDGFAKGAIKAIAQTPDGYLWLGTDLGLLRFDGIRAVPWQPPDGQPLPSEDVWSLLAARDGALWIGTAKGVARWAGGTLTVYPELAGRIIWALFEDRQNTVWVSGSSVPTGRLCAIRDRNVQCAGDDGRLGYGVLGIGEDGRGNLWIGVGEGIWRWKPGPPTFFPLPGVLSSVHAFEQDRDGALLLCTPRGIRRFVDGRIEPQTASASAPRMSARLMMRDRDGGLWIATTSGVVRTSVSTTDTFSQADGLSGGDVHALFEDREGSVWAGTTAGLDRFSDVVVASVSDRQGLSNPRASTVRTAPDGRLWVGTPESLETWQDGEFTAYQTRARALVTGAKRRVIVKGFRDEFIGAILPAADGRVWAATTAAFGYLEGDRFVDRPDVHARAVRSITEDRNGTIWAADQELGLVRIPRSGPAESIPWRALGHDDFATVVAADPGRDALWLGFWDGGIGRYEQGRIRERYSAAQGLGGGRVTNLRFAPDGCLWVATQGGLSRLCDGNVRNLGRQQGLPCDALHWAMPDSHGAWWMDTPCGLLRVAGDQIASWLADGRRSVTPAVFDTTAGVSLQALPRGYEPYAARARDGIVWFIGPNGLNRLDPTRLGFNPLPPPVHVVAMIADGRPIDVRAGSHPRLPALTNSVQIDYTALSLVAPEKVRFRYRLDGHDGGWQEVGNRRQAFYTNLPPGEYRFRVSGTNNSGLWNEAGASIAFSVAPAYYQTVWFRALVAGTLIALVWGGHRLRLRVAERHERQISALNERLMKAQEQERIRIAGELHDGVMQELLAVTMMLGTAKRRIGGNSDAAATIDKAQQTLIQAGTDIRQLSHDLHPPLLQEAGLPKAVTAYCDQFSATSGIAVVCDADDSVGELSRGAALALFRILQEALGNAAKHASATSIRVRLTRPDHGVQLLVSDDGVGFDRGRLARAGGLGLVMMRERASQMNGAFEFETAPGRGTTIRVLIPFR